MIAPELDPKGLDTKAVHIAALVVNGEEQTRMDSADVGFLSGMFSSAVAAKRKAEPEGKGGPRSIGPAPVAKREDSNATEEDRTPAARHAAMRERSANAWKPPAAKAATA